MAVFLRWCRARLLLLAWWSGLYLSADRRLLQRVILPYYQRPEKFPRALFVGVRHYTRKYPRSFPNQQFTTIDPIPGNRRFGAPHHIVDRIRNLPRHMAPASLNVIVLNAVIGWGLNDVEEVNESLDVCWDFLIDGGHLVVGVNEEIPTTPSIAALTALRRFRPITLEPLKEHRVRVETPFDERSHTYFFYQKS